MLEDLNAHRVEDDGNQKEERGENENNDSNLENKNNYIKMRGNLRYGDNQNKAQNFESNGGYDDIYDNMNRTNVLNSLNILNEDNMINHTSKKINVQVDMRRSLSFGDINDFRSNQKIKNVNEKYFGDNDGKGQDIPIDNNNYDIYVDSLDIIMNKLSNLEESLINLGLNDEDLKEKLFNIKSKEFEYSCSDSNSFHSDK